MVVLVARAFAMIVVTDRWRERLRFVAAYARRRATDVVALAHGAGSASERVDVHDSGKAWESPTAFSVSRSLQR